MKKLIILLFLLFSICSYGQKKPILDGIFDLRLGMSKQELFAVIDTADIEKRTYEDLGGTDYANRVEEIKIQKYAPIIDGEKYSIYKLNSISIKFLDNKAYFIYLWDDEDELEEVMIRKYGKPKKKGKLKTKTEKEYKPYAERTSEFDEVKSISVTTISDTRHKLWKTGDKDIECKSFHTDFDAGRYRIIDKKTQEKIQKRMDIISKNNDEKRANWIKEIEEQSKKIKENAYDAL